VVKAAAATTGTERHHIRVPAGTLDDRLGLHLWFILRSYQSANVVACDPVIPRCSTTS
jgi:hypothetical protein